MKAKVILTICLCVLAYSCATPISPSNEKTIQQPKVALRLFKQINSQQEIEIREGETLNQSDRYAVSVTSQSDAYIYIFQVDARQNRVQLFPNPRYSNRNNFVKSNETIRIPDNGRWFDSDKTKGIKEIFVLSPKMPLADPDRMVKYIIESSKGGGPAGETTGMPPFTDSSKPDYSKFYFLHR